MRLKANERDPSRAPWPRELRELRDRIRGEIVATAKLLHETCSWSAGDWWLEQMQDAVDAAERVAWGQPEPPVRKPPSAMDRPEWWTEEAGDDPAP